MDKKSEHRWRLKQLRLRSAIFFRKNGLYVMIIGCLAVLGTAAVLIFTADGEAPPDVPSGQSGDERLSDVLTQPANTPPPDGTASPEPTSPLTLSPLITPLPDFTPHPEDTSIPQIPGNPLQAPVDGVVIRVFAMNSLIYSETLQQWMTHSGVDIAAPKGSEVYAVLEGRVDSIYTDDMLGVTVVIAHENGMNTVYANLKEAPPVAVGDMVKTRAVIGYVGDTAISECAEKSHLHFEIHVNGSPVDPQSLIVFKKA